MGVGPPIVVVIEPDRELAVALQEVVTLARCRPVTLVHVEDLKQLAPAAIVVRMATNLPLASVRPGLKDLAGSAATKVLALASNDADVAEAERLGSDLILREPHQVRALYDALVEIAGESLRP